MPSSTRTRISLLMGLSVCIILPAAGWADCGSIPYSSPLELMGGMTILKTEKGITDVRFDPMDVVVFEPGQRAIILWNGREEILLLSTDIKTNRAVSLLEVIPLPGEPAVRLGDFDWFMTMQRLLIDKSMWRVASGGGVAGVRAPERAAEITFHKKMGVHDISVAHVLNRDGFTGWVEEFMTAKKAVNPKVDPAFAGIIGNYLERGTQWFVFDSLQADNQLQSRQPVEYRFKTDHLYYPLEISSRESGKTNIDLLVVTTQPRSD
ncbi:MAG: hypothetical protein HZB26_22840 [Candidatus Hydrogenedentes bacterium]|nr:hypothetical protein [Candidatus Hydrogenedentota bacterium]